MTGRTEFLTDVLDGLSASPRAIPCKHLYDARGLELFEQICTLPDYPLTRAELGLLRAHAPEIAALAGPGRRLVEFGGCSETKAGLLLDALQPSAYLPLDVARGALDAIADRLRRQRPGLAVQPVCADFTRPFSLPSGRQPILGFFPGSTIGNLPPAQARAFLTRAAAHGPLLIGVDLIKPVPRLLRAYDDPQGVTAAFTLNLLARINRQLGADFRLEGFRHRAGWDQDRLAVTIHLECLHDQAVQLGEAGFRFHAGERIHVEDSHKYRLDSFHALARAAGYRPERWWVDDDAGYSLHYLVPLL